MDQWSFSFRKLEGKSHNNHLQASARVTDAFDKIFHAKQNMPVGNGAVHIKKEGDEFTKGNSSGNIRIFIPDIRDYLEETNSDFPIQSDKDIFVERKICHSQQKLKMCLQREVEESVNTSVYQNFSFNLKLNVAKNKGVEGIRQVKRIDDLRQDAENSGAFAIISGQLPDLMSDVPVISLRQIDLVDTTQPVTCKVMFQKFPGISVKHGILCVPKAQVTDRPVRPKNIQKQRNDQTNHGQFYQSLILKQLLCGAFAGVVSRTAVAPLELIKTHLVTSHGLQGTRKSALAICNEIMQQSGWQGLFRGNLVNCIRVAPSKAVELCVFETVKGALNKEGHPLKNAASILAGGAAGMAGTIATYPLELIRTRLSVQPELYEGLLHAIKKIATDEGFLAFFSGLNPSLIGVFPYAATNYFVYDALRTTYCQTMRKKNVPMIPTVVFGAVSAAVSSTVTYPLEVARRQMQLCLKDAAVKSSSFGIILEIYHHEGFLALYRGLGTTWLKLIPAAGISFVCYEAAKLALCIDDASTVKPEEHDIES